MKFHERLKQTRQKRNISIRRICRDLGIRKSTYENWEASVYPSRPEVYKKLTEYLEVPLEYLMFGERKNTEWDETAFHLKRYLEEFITSQLREMLEEHSSRETRILGQCRAVLSQ
jgi:transcriptional regulator with XRE-family HTH domain